MRAVELALYLADLLNSIIYYSRLLQLAIAFKVAAFQAYLSSNLLEYISKVFSKGVKLAYQQYKLSIDLGSYLSLNLVYIYQFLLEAKVNIATNGVTKDSNKLGIIVRASEASQGQLEYGLEVRRILGEVNYRGFRVKVAPLGLFALGGKEVKFLRGSKVKELSNLRQGISRLALGQVVHIKIPNKDGLRERRYSCEDIKGGKAPRILGLIF